MAVTIYKAAQTTGIRGINYSLSGESYRVSEITLMLNNQAPVGRLKTVYNSDMAKHDLAMHCKPAIMSLKEYSA